MLKSDGIQTFEPLKVPDIYGPENKIIEREQQTSNGIASTDQLSRRVFDTNQPVIVKNDISNLCKYVNQTIVKTDSDDYLNEDDVLNKFHLKLDADKCSTEIRKQKSLQTPGGNAEVLKLTIRALPSQWLAKPFKSAGSK